MENFLNIIFYNYFDYCITFFTKGMHNYYIALLFWLSISIAIALLFFGQLPMSGCMFFSMFCNFFSNFHSSFGELHFENHQIWWWEMSKKRKRKSLFNLWVSKRSVTHTKLRIIWLWYYLPVVIWINCFQWKKKSYWSPWSKHFWIQNVGSDKRVLRWCNASLHDINVSWSKVDKIFSLIKW